MDVVRNMLFHGDCLSVLPTIPSGTVDAVIADPPYSSGGMTAGTRQADPVAKYQQMRQSDKFHLTGKPTKLLRDLVKVAPEGGLVLDPFEGRGYIGIEMDPVYAEIARKRISEAKTKQA